MCAKNKDQNERCHHVEWCCFPGAGCSHKHEEGCTHAQKIVEAMNYRCPLLCGEINLSDRDAACDIPQYRALLKENSRCHNSGRCLVRSILMGKIPVQDFMVTVSMPDNYKQKRSEPLSLQQKLRAFGV